ncbi:hypothetical protein C8R42DRAFT_722890 [Lentinula raphanica]|nr:hypothetical protein C8R42DRAFT_722890 [Lentinula raphanica]
MSNDPSAQAHQTAQQLLYPPNIQHNTLTLTSIKFLSAVFAGATAGILGLTNLAGFGLFALAMLWSAGCVYVVCCKGKLEKYMPGAVTAKAINGSGWSGVMELVNPGSDNAFTFVLVWTLFYGIVHVYD